MKLFVRSLLRLAGRAQTLSFWGFYKPKAPK